MDEVYPKSIFTIDFESFMITFNMLPNLCEKSIIVVVITITENW